MKNKLFYSQPHRRHAIRSRCYFLAILLSSIPFLADTPHAVASDAPGWMHAVVSAPVPAHDEKTDAVLLYSENILSVQPNGKIKSTERRAYKILRPGGKEYGTVRADFDSETRITSIHGWCIPAQGKDYEVKEKDSAETALFGVMNGELISDLKTKVLQIPAADPGNIVGYEIEQEMRPYVLQDVWNFQELIPVREAHYTLQLAPGWEYKATWLNHPEIKPVSSGGNQFQWSISDLKAIRPEDAMPPWHAVAAQMVISLIPQGGGGSNKGFENWNDMGRWEQGLAQGRRDASSDIKQKVTELTGSSKSQLAKMQALAQFVQRDVRYVAIQLGIGGWQPHPASEIFSHRYGDCKDKATLMSSMLKEIGVDSYYVSVNTERGAITPETPAIRWFNHEILAVRLPDGLQDDSVTAVMQHPKLGRLLIFDPTDELTPFGTLRGVLQGSYGLLVTPEGGELLQLPRLPASANGIQRTGKLTLSPSGTLQGDIKEVRYGDRASSQREALRTVSKDADRVKPIETMLAHSMSAFRITKASIGNPQQTELPFIYNYSVVADNYAKTAGDLILVRPRVVGNKTSDFLETKEPRQYPVEFDGPSRDMDSFEITIPVGYTVDDLPPPVSADYSFASYHSKAEVNGNTLRYTRTFEVKELSVPLSKVDDLKKLYRVIANDERNTAVLKPVAK